METIPSYRIGYIKLILQKIPKSLAGFGISFYLCSR